MSTPIRNATHRQDTKDCVIGVDLGTSGCRLVAIDAETRELVTAKAPLPASNRQGPQSEQEPECWWQTLVTLLRKLIPGLAGYRVRALAVDATSSTLLLADRDGRPLGPALMYDDARATTPLPLLQRIAPPESPVHSPTSSLAKLLYLDALLEHRDSYPLHQADWVLGRLTGDFMISDENNCLKLGYDAQHRRWPPWLERLGIAAARLPRVLPPGTPVGPISTTTAKETNLPGDTLVVTGTTDSTAAVLATGVSRPGEAVTVLGSTLVLKVIATRPVSAPAYGVYSHRLGDHWLVGGASNSGGAVLAAYFTPEQMAELTASLSPDCTTGLDYYPLLKPGERFPINDPDYPPRLTPRPNDDRVFFQGLLEGIDHIEKAGYERLHELGAPRLLGVTSIGGGAVNSAWRVMRERCLGVPVSTAVQRQPAYGAALLALKGLTAYKN